MNKNKDRIIRRTNLPSRTVVYTVYDGNYRVVYAVLSIIAIVLLFNIGLFYGIFGIVLFVVYLMKSRKTMVLEICKDCIIRYIDTSSAEIIYYDEIVNYQVKQEDHRYLIKFLLTDTDEYEYSYADRNITHYLDELIGEKNASK